MTNMRILLSILLLITMVTNRGLGAIYFNDGEIHNIDSLVEENIYVDYQSPGTQTTLNLLNNSRIGTLPYGKSVTAYNDSRINMSSGSRIYGELYAYDGSQITISGGRIESDLIASGNSHVTLGGTVIGDVRARDNSDVTITALGSPAGGYLTIADDSRVILSGGGLYFSQGNQLHLSSSEPMMIIGSDFKINGIPTGYITLTQEVIAGYPGDIKWFTCNLANGGGINIPLAIGSDSSIILTPEPATILLLGLGGLLLRKQSA